MNKVFFSLSLVLTWLAECGAAESGRSHSSAGMTQTRKVFYHKPTDRKNSDSVYGTGQLWAPLPAWKCSFLAVIPRGRKGPAKLCEFWLVLHFQLPACPSPPAGSRTFVYSTVASPASASRDQTRTPAGSVRAHGLLWTPLGAGDEQMRRVGGSQGSARGWMVKWGLMISLQGCSLKK